MLYFVYELLYFELELNLGAIVLFSFPVQYKQVYTKHVYVLKFTEIEMKLHCLHAMNCMTRVGWGFIQGIYYLLRVLRDASSNNDRGLKV